MDWMKYSFDLCVSLSSLLFSSLQVSYLAEHTENFGPTKWEVKLITKRGDEVVEKDRVLSANDVIGDRIRKLKVTFSRSPGVQRGNLQFSSRWTGNRSSRDS